MKKLLSLMMAMLLLASALTLTGCSQINDDVNNDTTESVSSEAPVSSEEPEEPAYQSAVALYEAIWAAYGEDNKFACAGGDAEHSAEAPAQFALTDENKETFVYLLHVTDELYDMLEDDVATLQHMMNTNTYSSAVAKLKDASQAADFAEAYKTAIQSQQWMCGFPDMVIVIQMGDYVVMAYGSVDNISHLLTACTSLQEDAVVLQMDLAFQD